MVKRKPLFVLVAATLLGCSADADPPAPPAVPELDAQQLLVRASLDIRGVRPTTAELSQISDAPEQVDDVIAGFVDDPRFATRVRAIFADALRTRRDFYRYGAESLGLPEEDELRLQQAIAEEPLNLIAHVVLDDRPFSEILTADYTVVAPILLNVWPITQLDEPAGEGLVKARYDDLRPVAGVLSTNTFFWRHTSTVENANRGRTNAISRALLCEDYLDRPIDFPKDVDLTDSESIHNAISTNAACQACHATLDPFASHLWGFMYDGEDPQTWLRYQPQNERMWLDESEAEPAFFGTPTDGTLSGLAQAIAGDERFVACATRRVYEALLGRDAAFADEGQLASHREAFLTSGLSLKALTRSVLADPAYRGSSQQSDWGGTPEGVMLKLASPELLTSSLHELTGYRLSFDGRDATSLDIGVRALAGGSESGAATSPSLGHSLVQRRMAEGAARALIEGGAAQPALAHSRVGSLLAAADLAAKPSGATLDALVFEIRSLQATEGDIAALQALWSQVDTTAGPSAAWSALLTALLADPDLAVY